MEKHDVWKWIGILGILGLIIWLVVWLVKHED